MSRSVIDPRKEAEEGELWASPWKLTRNRNSIVEEERKWLHVDILEELIGSFGWWHLWIICGITLSNVCASIHIWSQRVLAPPINQWCVAPHEHCSNMCSNYMYDTSIFNYTIWNEWEITCDRKMLYNFLLHSAQMAGFVAGSVISGIFSDRWGRKWPLIIGSTAQFILYSWSGVAPWMYLFFTFRFLLSVSVGAINVSSFVLLLEIAGIKKRVLIITTWILSYTGVMFVLCALAYFVRDWRNMMLVVGALSLVPLTIYTIYIPESPRWLMANQKAAEAIRILELAARINGKPTEGIRDRIRAYMEFKFRDPVEKWPFAKSWRKPNTRKYWIVTIWTMYTVAFSMGIVMNKSKNVDDDYLFVNFLLEGCVSAGGSIISAISMVYINRRRTLCTSAFSLCLFSFLMAFNFLDEKSMIYQVFIKTCLFSTAMLWTTIKVFESEIFPTVVRSMAMGLTIIFHGFANTAALIVLNNEGPGISFMVVTFLNFVTGCISFLQPETNGFKLNDTVDEVEHFMARQKTENIKLLIEHETATSLNDEEVKRSIEMRNYQRRLSKKPKLKSADQSEIMFARPNERVNKYGRDPNVNKNEKKKSFKPSKRISESD